MPLALIRSIYIRQNNQRALDSVYIPLQHNLFSVGEVAKETAKLLYPDGIVFLLHISTAVSKYLDFLSAQDPKIKTFINKGMQVICLSCYKENKHKVEFLPTENL